MTVRPVPVATSGQLGPALRALRRAKGWSQAELGRRIGLSQKRISAIERNPESVAFDQLLTLLMALGAELLVRPRQAADRPSEDDGSSW